MSRITRVMRLVGEEKKRAFYDDDVQTLFMMSEVDYVLGQLNTVFQCVVRLRELPGLRDEVWENLSNALTQCELMDNNDDDDDSGDDDE